MKQPPRRPPLPNIDTLIDDSSCLVDYLYRIPYGEEDETLLEHVCVCLQGLSWHAQWRVWLRKQSRCCCCCHQENTLPHILAQLQACLLHDSSSLIWHIHNYEQDELEWKQDEMLRNWNIVRYFVRKDVEGFALNRQDQLDVQRIMQGIDQLVGCCEDDEKRKSPGEVLHDYYDNNNSSKAQGAKDNCVTAARRPSIKFCSWVASQCSRKNVGDDDDDEAKRLWEVVERVPQWRVRRAIRNTMPKDFLLKNASASYHCSGDYFCRGRALLASILMNANICCHPAMIMTPVPSLSSSACNVSSLIQDYLHPSNKEEEMPNVHGLVLALWDFHLNGSDIIESIRAFVSWFPVEPIVARYRTMLTTNVDSSSIQQVLRATDMVCALIGDEAEEWKEIWDDTFCRGTLLPLVHAVLLNQDGEALRMCALIGAALDRVLHHNAHVVVTACPQVGWISFLLSDLPAQDDITRTIVDQLGQLYAHMSAALTVQRRDERTESVILPPLSIYIDSVVNAAFRHLGPAHAWEHHVVRTLTLYMECDNVATEWIRCLSTHCKNEEPTTPLTESLHRHVCLSLWGPNTRKQLVPSVSLPQLLTQQQCAAGILLWTPPECLFAHQSNVVESLEQMLSVHGTKGSHLCHIVVGIALCAPNIPAGCRHVLYQHLEDIAVNGDYAFVKRVERELLPFPTSWEWWKELYADLVRNEVPIFMVKGGPSKFDAKLVDDILSERRKRQREEEGGRKEDQSELLTTKPKARSRESATTVLRKLWGNREHTVEKPLTNDNAINDAELPCVEINDSTSFKDDDDYFDDEEDDRILLV